MASRKEVTDALKKSDDADTGFAGGKPRMPRGLNARQKKLWQLVVSRMPETLLGEIDVIALELLVESYNSWFELNEKLKTNDFEEIKDGYMLALMASSEWKKVIAMLQKFGMTPRDRQHLLPAEKEPAGESDSHDFFSTFCMPTGN